jgi:hypothetical protein
MERGEQRHCCCNIVVRAKKTGCACCWTVLPDNPHVCTSSLLLKQASWVLLHGTSLLMLRTQALQSGGVSQCPCRSVGDVQPGLDSDGALTAGSSPALCALHPIERPDLSSRPAKTRESLAMRQTQRRHQRPTHAGQGPAGGRCSRSSIKNEQTDRQSHGRRARAPAPQACSTLTGAPPRLRRTPPALSVFQTVA